MPRFRGYSIKCEPNFSERFDFSASSVTSGQSVTSRSKLTPSSFFIYELTFTILLLLHCSLTAKDSDHVWLSSTVFDHGWDGPYSIDYHQPRPQPDLTSAWCSTHGAWPLTSISEWRLGHVDAPAPQRPSPRYATIAPLSIKHKNQFLLMSRVDFHDRSPA